MTRSLDEVTTEYGLLAESAQHPDDFAWVIYRLRKEARWHDGKPVTPEDVIFSLETLKQYSPMYASYYRHVAKTEKIGDLDVKFTFDSPGNRELPTIVGELTVLPKHYWEGTDSNGKKRDISANHTRAPAGFGSLIESRNSLPPDQSNWSGSRIIGASAAPTQIGQNNFDEMHFRILPRQPGCAGGVQGRPG